MRKVIYSGGSLCPTSGDCDLFPVMTPSTASQFYSLGTRIVLSLQNPSWNLSLPFSGIWMPNCPQDLCPLGALPVSCHGDLPKLRGSCPQYSCPTGRSVLPAATDGTRLPRSHPHPSQVRGLCSQERGTGRESGIWSRANRSERL